MIFKTLEQSRRDGTLLTVDFNLRTRDLLCYLLSPAGTTLWRGDVVSSLRDCGSKLFHLLLRRLKPPVNKMPSLQDFTVYAKRLQVVYFSHIVIISI